MRNLQAELNDWNCAAPVEWSPRSGDVLIGTVQEYLFSDLSDGSLSGVLVQEERTGLSVLVHMDNRELCDLFSLQSPVVGERIGLKYAGMDPHSSVGHFVLLLDREHSDKRPCAGPPRDVEKIDCTGEDIVFRAQSTDSVTSEESLAIQQALAYDDEEIVSQPPTAARYAVDAFEVTTPEAPTEAQPEIAELLTGIRTEICKQTRVLRRMHAALTARASSQPGACASSPAAAQGMWGRMKAWKPDWRSVSVVIAVIAALAALTLQSRTVVANSRASTPAAVASAPRTAASAKPAASTPKPAQPVPQQVKASPPKPAAVVTSASTPGTTRYRRYRHYRYRSSYSRGSYRTR